ncbi:metallopeptidase TldD-related protein [Chromobacterium piscinae]|uniref:TldD/PmbA family protein n=1 Tax=Chromobacterium piscinae TaxID=686831 RepID=UPI001E52A4DE|nr:metallopeptidase TldD-related protein [Chromobacterium piscinae]MCD4503836.1 metallopeptidase TldD-related protein [Chromobacterium piscinae]
MMRAHLQRLAAALNGLLREEEGFTLWLEAERTDFVRFNHGKVRQAGRVEQAYLGLRLIRGKRQATQQLSLCGGDDDLALLEASLPALREALEQVEDDPFLLLSEQPNSTERIAPGALPSAETMVADILAASEGLDLVGILACGEMSFGFANHLGQFNWQQGESWHFDWSLYSHGDKAVKRSQAGSVWDAGAIRRGIAEAAEQLALLKLPLKTLEPGEYRAYFTPTALGSLLSMLNWGGLSEKEARAKRSPLLKLVDGEAKLSPRVSLAEAAGEGLSPLFQAEGFIRPERVDLIAGGAHQNSLIGPRSAREFGLEPNAGADEYAESMQLAPGDLPREEALKALGTGVYLSNLWYLNFSDRAACRITGMTRFACFWVEDGKIVAPLGVMRFDDSLYSLLGEQLEALTAERELLVDAGSYGGRATQSKLLPGALVKALRFSL